MILDLVKRTSSPACDRPASEGPEVCGPCSRPGSAWALILLLGVIGVLGVIVAVFGHPVQAVAAAVIVSALSALAQGRSVALTIAGVAQVFMQSLKEANAQDQNGSSRLNREFPRRCRSATLPSDSYFRRSESSPMESALARPSSGRLTQALRLSCSR